MNDALEIRALYDAFNRRDVDAVLEQLHEDVEWPNVMEGRVIYGHDAVRRYWARQFELIDSRVTPRDVAREGDRIVVRVHQHVKDAATGAELSDSEVVHVYELRDGKVARMTVE